MILPLLAALTVVLTLSKLGGWLAGRLKQPVVLGKLLVGVALGPSVFNVFAQPYFAEAHIATTLHEFGELGVIFLMFAAGLEIQLADFLKVGKPALLIGTLGVILPMMLGGAVLWPFVPDFKAVVFLGIVMAATSVSISAQTLIELGQLRSREGLVLLGAAVVDDVLAIAVLSVFVALTQPGAAGALGVVWILARMAGFLVGAFAVGSWLLPRLTRWVETHPLPISEPVLSLVVISILAFAWMAEVVGGVAAITGAFIAGVALSSSSAKEKIERGIHSMAYTFFVPIFLVSIGLSMDARTLSASDLGLVVILCVVAILSKLVGAGGGAYWSGFSRAGALRVGIGMVSRGEVGLIVAQVGLTAGLLTIAHFTALVMMVLVTTLLTPPLLRWAFRLKEF